MKLARARAVFAPARPRIVFACALLASLAFVAPAFAAAQNAQAQREIERLIADLGSSGCRFERNGRWYAAAEAQAHLRRKYDYLRKRGLANTAELFIERGASESSTSGKPYRVRCGDAPAIASAQWFRQRLAIVRRSAAAAAKPGG
jgi:Family of unknown function (DUF5329)